MADLLLRRMQSKIHKRQRCTGQSLEDTRHQLPESLPGGDTQDARSSPAMSVAAHVKCRHQGSSSETSTRVLTVGWAHGILCGAHAVVPDSQEDCVQHKPRCLHDSLGAVSHSYQGMMGALPKSKFLDASQGPALHTGLSEYSSLRRAVCVLFS